MKPSIRKSGIGWECVGGGASAWGKSLPFVWDLWMYRHAFLTVKRHRFPVQ